MKTKYLIVGAGCSGLAFANNVIGEDYLIIEKENKAGGYCKSIYKDSFVWDYSGHFFHFATDMWKKYFEDRIDSADIVSVRKNTKIYYKTELIDFPFQKNIHQLSKEDFIDCLYDLFFREENDLYKSFKDMLYGKFGGSISEKFLIPYNEKLYACDLDGLDCNAMGRFFPYANIEEIIANMKNTNNESYNEWFLYPKRGAETFVNALIQDLDKTRILYNQELIVVNKKNHILKSTDYTIEYEYLINTIPLNEFINKVGNVVPSDKMGCNKVLVFNLGFDKESTEYKGIHWIYVPDKDVNFYRIGFYNHILNQDKLSMYIEIGYPADSKVDVDLQLTLTLENLKKMGVITDHKLLEKWHCVMNPAYVYLSDANRRYVGSVLEDYKRYNIFSTGRYGGWKYCSIEDCLVDATMIFDGIKNEDR